MKDAASGDGFMSLMVAGDAARRSAGGKLFVIASATGTVSFMCSAFE